jgi:hypothetical protein
MLSVTMRAASTECIRGWTRSRVSKSFLALPYLRFIFAYSTASLSRWSRILLPSITIHLLRMPGGCALVIEEFRSSPEADIEDRLKDRPVPYLTGADGLGNLERGCFGLRFVLLDFGFEDLFYET